MTLTGRATKIHGWPIRGEGADSSRGFRPRAGVYRCGLWSLKCTSTASTQVIPWTLVAEVVDSAR